MISAAIALIVVLSQPEILPADPFGGHVERLNLPEIRAALAAAPAEDSGQAGAVIGLPLPDGRFEWFEAWASPIMDPALAARFPDMTTYTARSGDGTPARIDLTPHGLHAVMRGGWGAALVGPLDTRVPDVVTSREWSQAASIWDCHNGPEHDPGHAGPAEPGYEPRGPLPRREYRFVMACTGEFAAFHSALQGRPANVPDALAAIVTIMNRLNFVFETDMNVRFNLVPNNDLVVFLDPETDPYHATDSGANLTANRNTLSQVIGNANYDVGHVVTRIPGGVAYLRAACGSNKGGGVSGTPRTVEPDPVSGEVVMHEVGHQCGANHSFNGSVDRCLNNRNGNTAWEPGSGTTIMSYTGGCPVGNVPPGDNIQVVRDFMFHVGSIGEMRSFLVNGSGSNCAVQVGTNNTAPTITLLPPAGLSIPSQTPFELVGAATDVENDPLTYSWEQFDLGPQQSLSGPDSADNGASPLFRVFPPSPSPERLFPQLSDVLSGTLTLGERLPTFSPAARKFRLAVRDNHPGGSGVTISGDVTLQIANAGPFVVTAPATGESARPGVYTVRWNVAGTSVAPVSTASVTIRLSTDGGLTFPLTLASETPNDGEAAVTLPDVESLDARVRIYAVGNVFTAFSPRFAIRSCDADVNCDGVPDQDDVACIILAVAGDTGCFCQADPDFNGDGVPDQDDVAAVILVVAGAACP